MGFLDHSTNNIIIDAVLTDTGRRMLANNQGNFKIAFFSLAVVNSVSVTGNASRTCRTESSTPLQQRIGHMNQDAIRLRPGPKNVYCLRARRRGAIVYSLVRINNQKTQLHQNINTQSLHKGSICCSMAITCHS